jgi:hypothetical protein
MVIGMISALFIYGIELSILDLAILLSLYSQLFYKFYFSMHKYNLPSNMLGIIIYKLQFLIINLILVTLIIELLIIKIIQR